MAKKKKKHRKPITGIGSDVGYGKAINTVIGGVVLIETVKLLKP